MKCSLSRQQLPFYPETPPSLQTPPSIRCKVLKSRASQIPSFVLASFLPRQWSRVGSCLPALPPYLQVECSAFRSHRPRFQNSGFLLQGLYLVLLGRHDGNLDGPSLFDPTYLSLKAPRCKLRLRNLQKSWVWVRVPDWPLAIPGLPSLLLSPLPQPKS